MSDQEETVATPEAEAFIDSIADAASSKSEDEWLAENVIDEEPEEAPAVETPEATTEETTPEEQPEEAKPSEETPEATPEELAEYESSLLALRLDKWTTEDIEALTKEQVASLGKRAKARQTEVSKTLEERAARIKELETQATTKAEPPSGEPTVDADLKDLLKPLRDEHGDDFAGPLEKAFGSVVQKAEARAKQAEEALAARTGLMEQTIYELTRQQLGERFPGLKDPSTWEKVLSKAVKFDGSDYRTEGGTVFSAASGMVRDAAKLLGLEDALEAKRRESAAVEERTRENGLPTTRTETTPAKAMNEDDKETWIALEIEKGRPWEEVAREAGTLR